MCEAIHLFKRKEEFKTLSIDNTFQIAESRHLKHLIHRICSISPSESVQIANARGFTCITSPLSLAPGNFRECKVILTHHCTRQNNRILSYQNNSRVYTGTCTTCTGSRHLCTRLKMRKWKRKRGKKRVKKRSVDTLALPFKEGTRSISLMRH